MNSNNTDQDFNKLKLKVFIGILITIVVLIAIDRYSSTLKDAMPISKKSDEVNHQNNASTLALGGEHICWIDQQDKTWCWGNNDSGQLGRRHVDPYSQAQHIDKDLKHPFKQISAYRNRTCAINTQDEVYCWGGWMDLDYEDQPITSEIIASMKPYKLSYEPLKIALPQAPQSVELGILHACALLKNNEVWCWGDNSLGQLALDDSTELAEEPLQIQNLPQDQKWQRLVAGPASNCVISTAGNAWCWGLNLSAYAMDSLSVSSLSRDPTKDDVFPDDKELPEVIQRRPLPLNNVNEPIQDIAFNLDTACVLTDKKDIKCWGGNTFNAITGFQGEDFISTATAIKDRQLKRAHALSASSFNMSPMPIESFFCALANKNKAYCWGVLLQMEINQIGKGHLVKLPKIDQPWMSIKSGQDFSCVQAQNHDVYCWGRGLNGGVYSKTQVLPKDFNSQQVYQLLPQGII